MPGRTGSGAFVTNAERRSLPSGPRVVAHRAGNRLPSALAAAGRGEVVEADVHVFRGRIEVRHEKVLRPSGRLWEPWRLLPRSSPRRELDDVVRVVGPQAVMLLDLKCFTRRAARRIRAAVPDEMDVIVSSRSWWTLAAFGDRPGTLALRSCANRPQLWLGARLPGLSERLGLTAHDRLLSPELVVELRRRTPEVFAWAISSPDRCRSLVRAGLTGVVLDDTSIADFLTGRGPGGDVTS